MTAIEWTDKTWNPVRGCTKISPGCKHCYAEGFDLRLAPHKLSEPLKWTTPQQIFVNSMSDLHQEGVPIHYVLDCYKVMRLASWHVFQVLTKRVEHMATVHMMHNAVWGSIHGQHYPQGAMSNVWLGVSVEDRTYGLPRIDVLRTIPARVRFLSIEPLLEDLGPLDLRGIHWVIVGGESGLGARELKPEWVRSIRDQCVAQGVPFLFKQWGGVRKKLTGRLLDGRTWDEKPPATITTLTSHAARKAAIAEIEQAAKDWAAA